MSQMYNFFNKHVITERETYPPNKINNITTNTKKTKRKKTPLFANVILENVFLSQTNCDFTFHFLDGYI